MPRPLLIRSDHHPYHVTSRCNNKEYFPIPMKDVWKIMVEELNHVHREHKLAIHAFVLMSNHFHLLCHTPKANLDQVMHAFLRRTSVRITRRAGQINHLWGARYKWSLIESQRYYMEVYRYIFQNPVRAKITGKVEDYAFSSLNSEMTFPLHSFVPMAFGGKEGECVWLNQKYDTEQQELIQLGLKKCLFEVSKSRQNGPFREL